MAKMKRKSKVEYNGSIWDARTGRWVDRKSLMEEAKKAAATEKGKASAKGAKGAPKAKKKGKGYKFGLMAFIKAVAKDCSRTVGRADALKEFGKIHIAVDEQKGTIEIISASEPMLTGTVKFGIAKKKRTKKHPSMLLLTVSLSKRLGKRKAYSFRMAAPLIDPELPNEPIYSSEVCDFIVESLGDWTRRRPRKKS